MKKLLFLSIFMLLTITLFAGSYSSDAPAATDNASMDVTFSVGDPASDNIIVAFTDTPCTSFDDDLIAKAKPKINMVFDGSGNYAITDKKYYISYIIVTTETNVKLKLTASKKISHTVNETVKEFAYEITTDSGKILKSDDSKSNPLVIPIDKSSSYGVYGSVGFTIRSKSNVGSNDIYGADYSGWLSVEVITV